MLEDIKTVQTLELHPTEDCSLTQAFSKLRGRSVVCCVCATGAVWKGWCDTNSYLVFQMITLLSPKLIHIYFEMQALLAHAEWVPQLKLPHLSAASFCFCKLISQGGKKKGGWRGPSETMACCASSFPLSLPRRPDFANTARCSQPQPQQTWHQALRTHFQGRKMLKDEILNRLLCSDSGIPLPVWPTRTESSTWRKAPSSWEEHSLTAGALVEATHLSATLQRHKPRTF